MMMNGTIKVRAELGEDGSLNIDVPIPDRNVIMDSKEEKYNHDDSNDKDNSGQDDSINYDSEDDKEEEEPKGDKRKKPPEGGSEVKKKKSYPHKFSVKWIKKGKFPPVICRSDYDEDKAYCKACEKTLVGGATQITRHLNTRKHKKKECVMDTWDDAPREKDKFIQPTDNLVLEYDNDSDLNFFRGILPHVRCLSARGKIAFQIKMLELLNNISSPPEEYEESED